MGGTRPPLLQCHALLGRHRPHELRSLTWLRVLEMKVARLRPGVLLPAFNPGRRGGPRGSSIAHLVDSPGSSNWVTKRKRPRRILGPKPTNSARPSKLQRRREGGVKFGASAL